MAANLIDDLSVYSDRAVVKIADEAYAAAVLLSADSDATAEINRVTWWTQLLTGANDTANSLDVREALLSLLVNSAKLNGFEAPTGIYGLYQPVLPTETASVPFDQVTGPASSNASLVAYVAGIVGDYVLKSGDTMTGNLLFASGLGIDAATAGPLNIGITNATVLTIGRTGQTVNFPGTIGQGTWQGNPIGRPYGGLGNSMAAIPGNNYLYGYNVVDEESVFVAFGTGLSFDPGTNTLSATGDVSGPGSSTDNAIVRWNGTSGAAIQNSVVLIGDTGAITGALSLNGHTVPGGSPSTLAILSNNLGQFGATTSAQLRSVISDETGTGALVFATSPQLVTPNIGAATGSSLAVTGALTTGDATAATGRVVWQNDTNNFTQSIRGSVVSANIAYVLPTTDPTAGQVLTAAAPVSNVSQLSWSSALANPMDGPGQIIYGGAAGAPTKLAADTSNTKKYLSVQSIAGVGQPPQWSAITTSDLPVVTLAKGGTGAALSDPNANRFFFWDDTTNATVFAVLGSGLSYDAVTKTVSVSASGIVASVTGTVNEIDVDNTDPSNPIISMSATYAGNVNITTLGTVGTGTWEAAIIDGPFGGTGFDVTSGTPGDSIRVNAGGTAWEWYTPGGGGGSGTVTSVSVVSANGFAGSVANATTTPAITLTTSITGILKGNGTAISAATAGTDYVVPGAITSSGLTMATARILGRTAASTGAIQEVTVSTGLTLSSTTLTIDSTVVTLTGAQALSNKTGLISQWTNDAGYLTGAAGSNGEIQYNNGGALGGIPALTSDGTDVIATAANFFISSPTDRKIVFQVGSSASTTRTLTTQDSNGTLALLENTLDQFATTNTVTLGTASTTKGSLVLRNAASAFTQTISGSNPGADIEYVLPTADPTVGQVLTASAPSAGVVTLSWGAGTAGANTALSNLASVSINASLTPQSGQSLGGAVNPWRYLYLYGNGTYGSDYFQFTGKPTAGRTITIPDDSITLARIDAAQTFTGAQTFSTSVVSALYSAASSIVFRPGANGTTAYQFLNSAGTASVMVIDTTNTRVGINAASVAPSYPLHIAGDIGGISFGIVSSNTLNGAQMLLNCTGTGGRSYIVGTAGSGGSGGVAGSFFLYDNTASAYRLVIAGGASAQAASTEAPGFDFRQYSTRQWATGAITTQRDFYIRTPTYSFVGASTISDAYTFYADAGPTAGTNATITRSWSAGFNGRVAIATNLMVGTLGVVASALINAQGTTEQLRLGYDASNYLSFTVGSTGSVTLDAVGSGSSFTLSDRLDVTSGVAANITSVSADTTLDGTHFTVRVDASGATRTITLPAASGCTRRIYFIKKVDSSGNTVTIDGNGSETIDGSTTKVLSTQYAGYGIQSDGSNWNIISAF